MEAKSEENALPRISSAEDAFIVLAHSGKSEAFQRLYEIHRRRVYQTAFRYSQSPQDAEDILQETFIKAFTKMGSLKLHGASSFSCWLNKICIRVSIEHLRRCQRQYRTSHVRLDDLFEEPRTEMKSPEQTVIAELARARLILALGVLSPRQQIIFDMRFRQQMEIRRISETMGLSESNIKTQLGRSVAKLRSLLGRPWRKR